MATKYYIAGATTPTGSAVGSDANSGLTPALPWATISKWKTAIFDNGLMTTGDEVVISGLVREPFGVVLNAAAVSSNGGPAKYAVGSRWMKGFRQWRWSDGPVGTPGTQNSQVNSIARARVTCAQILTGTITVSAGHTASVTMTNTYKPPLGSSGGAAGLASLSYRYYDSLDRYGRHYGFFAYSATSIANSGSNDYHHSGSNVITFDAARTSTIDDTTANRYEYTMDQGATGIAGGALVSVVGAILQFQYWEGHGPNGEALCDGIIFDRGLINKLRGSYAVSMENCINTGIRNCIAYDCGHHAWGITGTGNTGNWLQNVKVMGLFGLDVSTNGGGQGGNSMTCGGTLTADGVTLTGTSSTVLYKANGFGALQTPVPGTPLKILSGTGLVGTPTVTVTELTTYEKITVTPAIPATLGASNLSFEAYNICTDHLVENFDYHIYPLLGVYVNTGATAYAANTNAAITPFGAAVVASPKVCYGLNNNATATSTSRGSLLSLFKNNVYRRGSVRAYPETLINSGAIGNSSNAIIAGNHTLGYATNLEVAESYPLRFEDVNFTDFHSLDGAKMRDVSFKRCNFSFAPSVFSDSNTGKGIITLKSNSGNNITSDNICRLLFDSSIVVANLGNGGYNNLTGIKTALFVNSQGYGKTSGNWSGNVAGSAIGGTFSNMPVPHAGHTLTLIAGTNVSVPQILTISSAGLTYVNFTTPIVGNGSGAFTDLQFDMSMAEVRARNSTFLGNGIRYLSQGGLTSTEAAISVAYIVHCGSGSVGLTSRGALFDFRNCVMGYDHLHSSVVTHFMFGSDGNYSGSTSDRRIAKGNVYMNIQTFSDHSSFGTPASGITLGGIDTTGRYETGQVIMNPPWGNNLIPSSDAATTPPPFNTNTPLGGANQLRFSGLPGGFQAGSPIDSTPPRGHGR